MTLNHLFDRPQEIIPAARAIPDFPAIVGLDPSMTATGLAVHWPAGEVPVGYHETREIPAATALHLVRSKPVQSGKDAKGKPAATWEDRRLRLADIVARVVDVVPDESLVFMEAPSYGSTGSGTFDRSGLWWALFAALRAVECRVVPVSPAQRMQYATGKGGGRDAGKDAVIAAVTRRYPDLDVRDNNVADAVVLCMMARRAAGVPVEDFMPAANLKALDKLEPI